MTDGPRPAERSARVVLPAAPSPIDPLVAFATLFLGLDAQPFRLGGLRGFSGIYRLIEVDDVENAVIIERERDGQRLGLGIADFVDAYRRGHNDRPDGGAQ